MFSSLIGGGLGAYDDVVSPILDINDKLISQVAPDSGFLTIAETLSNAKKEALGDFVGEYEDIQFIQEKENDEKKRKGEIAGRFANQPRISK